MNNKNILVVAATTGYQTRSIAEAAGRVGVNVILATDRCHVLEDPWRDRAIAVKFEEPEASAATIERDLAGREIAGIVAVADRPALLASCAARKMWLECHPPEAARICLNKHSMRESFAAAGLLVPKFQRLSLETKSERLEIPFPCVLKPLGLSASRGVIRANDRREFDAAVDRIRRLLERKKFHQADEALTRTIQVESYIPGREFALEGIMTRGVKIDRFKGILRSIFTPPARAKTSPFNFLEWLKA